MLILFYKLPLVGAGLSLGQRLGYRLGLSRSHGIRFSSARLPPSLNSALIYRRQNGSQGTRESVRNLLPGAHKLTPSFPVPHTDASKECSISRWSSHVCSGVHIKALQRASSPASSSSPPPLVFSLSLSLLSWRCVGAKLLIGVCARR